MSDREHSGERRSVFVRRLLLGAALVFAIAACGTAIGAYFVRPSFPVWVAIVTVAAISLEVLFWTAAGVFGWSFLAKRRARLERWRQRFFGGKARPGNDAEP